MYLQTGSGIKTSKTHTDFLEVPEAVVEKVKTRIEQHLHLVQANHALLVVFDPVKPSLLLVIQSLDQLAGLQWVVFAKKCNVVAI